MSIILHIGASKCGSSAIQTALSAQPDIRRHDGSMVRYAVIEAHGDRIIDGERLTASLGVHGYRGSPNAKDILAHPMKGVAASLSGYAGDVVLSCEGWLFQPGEWREILDRLDIEVEILVYVRPQVPVLNSAWWQWGAWSGVPFDKWIAARLKGSLWGRRISKWAALPRVRNLVVRPVPDDVVEDLYEHVLRAPVPAAAAGARPNPGLPGPVLRLFQRNRELRPGAHDSRIDFALAAALKMRDRPIWVMTEEWIERVLAATKDDNRLLMSFMDPVCAAAVENDPRWWSPGAYADRKAEPPGPQPLSKKALEGMCVEMAKAILRLSSPPRR